MLTSDDVAQVQLPITPAARALREYIAVRWNVNVGAPRGASVRKPLRNARGELRRRDIHEEGRALDVMVRGALGDEIANWLALNARELGLQYVLWDRVELSSAPIGPAWEPYEGVTQWGTPRDPHTNHIHVEISTAYAADGARMRRVLGMAPRSDANESAPVGGSSVRSSNEGARVERTRTFTGPRPFDAWAQERFELAYLALRDAGLPSLESLHTARALVALWVTETGWNEAPTAGESNFNPGNITGHSPYGLFRIPGNPRQFRAYAEAREGVDDAVRVLSQGRYRAAWDSLVVGGDPVEWYSAILRAGYTPWAQGLVDQFAGVLRRIPQRLKR